MNLSKKDRDGMRQALSFLDGFTFTEDEDEFMAGSGLGGICVDLGQCLDDLDETHKGRELAVKLAVIATDKLHAKGLRTKDEEIKALKADLVDEMAEVENWCHNHRSLQQSFGSVYDEREKLKRRTEELKAELRKTKVDLGEAIGAYHG